MKYDLIIKNGTIIDPLENIEKKQDIYILKDKIVEPPKETENIQCPQIINAKGCYILPGLIENHTHIYKDSTDVGLPCDVIMLPSGVTSAIDQGSSGWSTFDGFYKNVVLNSIMNVKCYLNVSNTGLITEDYFENIDPALFNREMIEYYTNKYKETIIGLKIRLDKNTNQDVNKALDGAIELAESLSLPLSVHIKGLENIEQIAKKLRKDDIWIHMYQLKGETIFDERGKIKKEIQKAKERGVYFDVASGRSSFSFEMIKNSLKQGFKPDLLGTDLVTYNAYTPPIFSLPYTMSIYLNLGFTIMDLAKICIQRPAEFMNMHKDIATLKTDTTADIAIFKIKEKEFDFYDKHGGSLKANKLLVPLLTIKNGKVMYRNIEF